MFDVSNFIGHREYIVCYARVSTSKQRDQLDNQSEYLTDRYPGAEVIKDIGSGLNFKRKGLQALLERALRGDKLTVVVAHRDRLARFGFDLIEWIVKRSGGTIVVLNDSRASPAEELVKDLTAIVTLFSARLHGLRSYKAKLRDKTYQAVLESRANPKD